MRETLPPGTGPQLKRIWAHFLLAKGKGFRLLWNRLAEEHPQVCDIAYTEVRQWRAQSFGWLCPENFDQYIEKLRQLDGSSAASCRARKRKRREGGYPAPEVSTEQPLFGPPEEFPYLIKATLNTTPRYTVKVLKTARAIELSQLECCDTQIFFPDHDFTDRRRQLYIMATPSSGITSSPEDLADWAGLEFDSVGERSWAAYPAEAIVAYLTHICIRIVNRGGFWTDFGYNGKPSRGRLVLLLKQTFEDYHTATDFMLREMTSVCIATIADSLHTDTVGNEELAARIIEHLFDFDKMPTVYGFRSRRDATQYLAQAVGNYMGVRAAIRPAIFWSRAKNELDAKRQEEWISGAIRLCLNFTSSEVKSWIDDRLIYPVIGPLELGDTSLIRSLDRAQDSAP